MPGDDNISDLLGKLEDRAITKVGGGWMQRADETQKAALGLIVGAAVLGPLGQGFVAAMKALYSSELPSSEQVKAVFFLALLTAPVFAAAAVGTYYFGKAALGALLAASALAAVGGCYLMGLVGVPKSLGDVYCYNDGTVLEHECREFNTDGFVTDASGKNSTDVLGLAFSYTADARGTIMALCGVAAGVGAGYLARRESERT